MIRAFLLLPLLFCANVASAASPYVKSAVADLNGDGVKEKISLVQPHGWDYGNFTLIIGKDKIKGKLDEGVQGFVIMDIDRNDKYKEVVVHTDGPSIDPGDAVYWYDGNKIHEMGYLDGEATYAGSGVVYLSYPLDSDFTYSVNEKYVLEPKTHKLVEVPQELYYLGLDFQVTRSFPIYQTRDTKTVLANLAPGSTATVIAWHNPEFTTAGTFKKVTTADYTGDQWYLIKSKSGFLGWSKLKNWTDYADGLPLAD